MATGTEELFAHGRQSLQALIAELAAHNVHVDPELELHAGEGLLCWYSFLDRRIYLALPDPTRPQGKFTLLLFRSVMNLESSAQVMRLLGLLTPWLIAHETAHHLRHRYGLWSAAMWEEEEIANELACAFMKRRLTLAQQKEVRDLFSSALPGLAHIIGSGEPPADGSMPRQLLPYLYTHMQCFHRGLAAEEEPTIGAFVKAHLQQHPSAGALQGSIHGGER